MSNLVPTPRTDKNGRVVVRHMKPETGASSLKSLPQVSPLPVSLLSSYTDDDLIEAFGLNNVSVPTMKTTILRGILIMREEKEATSLALELINYGNEKLAESVRKKAVTSHSRILNYSYSPGGYVDAEKRCQEAWGPSTIPELILEWAKISVIESLDIDPDSLKANYLIDDGINKLHTALTDDEDREARGKDFDHWRNMSLLHFMGIRKVKSKEGKRTALELSEWLDRQEDAAAIVRLARERKVYTVKELEDLTEQVNVNPSLSSGIL